METNPNDIVVAVMGVTGAGKSSFIKTMTGRQDIVIGHNLTSQTSQVQQYRFTHDSTSFVLVDTPGFNDTNETNETITSRILQWLESSFRAGTRLNGVVYLHRICEPRMQGSSFENIRMFRQLCGDDALKNVILATTFWNSVTERIGAKRERELESQRQFWGQMVKKGSRVMRLGQDKESGLRILMGIAKNQKVAFQVQTEMVTQGLSIQETSAARATLLALQVEMDEILARELQEVEEALFWQEEEEKMRLHREKERVRQEAEARRKREEVQRRKEEEEYLKQQAETKRLFEEEVKRKQKELAEKEARIERERLLEMERGEEEARQARQRYYSAYICKRRPVAGRFCDKCKESLHKKWKYYYHCCHCDADDYNHCGNCGNVCPVDEHPYMTRRETLDECVIL